MKIYGYDVTLNADEGKKILLATRLQIKDQRVQIWYNQQWLNLCRADLKDDVGTFTHEDVTRGIERTRHYYLVRIHYGVRVDENSWRVIDSVSDG